MNIVEFIESRIAEDEQIAREAIIPARPGMHWKWETLDDPDNLESLHWLRTVEEFPTTSGVGDLPGFPLGYDCKAAPSAAMNHIARHDPARVLREVAAKRELLATCARYQSMADQDINLQFLHGAAAGIKAALDAIAAAYSDHPDYQQDWATP